MAASLPQDIDPILFLHGFEQRQNELRNLERNREKSRDGTALWILGSFMNHSTSNPTVIKEVFGKMMFVRAGNLLRAGTELTTVYSYDPEGLKRQWGIEHEF